MSNTNLKGMLYRTLDANGDYIFGLGSQSFLTDVNAVAQAVKTNLLLLQGEWWEDTSIGLPLFQNILGQTGSQSSQQSIDLLVQAQIINTPGVIDIYNYQGVYDKRIYSISCNINTQFGDIQIQVPLNIPI